MQHLHPISKFAIPGLLVACVCLLFASSGGYFSSISIGHERNVSTPTLSEGKGALVFPPLVASNSNVSCTPWQDLLLGTGSGSSTYNTCEPDTALLSTNAVTASGATSDNQEIVWQELCGNGELIAKVSSLTGGYAGLFVRESNAGGARKCAIMTQKGAQVFRQLRITTNGPQTQASYTAPGHQWLKITRSGTQVMGAWSTNGTTWNTAFITPLSMTDCVIIGLAAYSTNSNTTIDATFTNISVAQSDTPAATAVSFVDSSLTAQAGDTVAICVQIANPCYCNAVSVEVALSSDSLPHLPGFVPQVLTFSEGDTVACFSIVLAESDSSKSYTFELTGLTGGYDSQYGEATMLTLEVEGGEEETQPGICGSFIRDAPAILDSSNVFLYDRFGNIYLLDELLLPASPPEINCGCDEFLNDIPYQDENFFHLYFEDCINPAPTPMGFADAVQGTARRRAACKAYAYLSHLILRSDNPCEEESFPVVNILVRADENLPAGVLASASPFYDYRTLPQFPYGGIIDGLPWKLINNGNYQLPTSVPPIIFDDQEFDIYEGYHGAFSVNFSNFGFYTGDATPPDDSNNYYDLYHTVLHEALHILGFASLIQPDNGSYRLPFTKSYSRYDTYLYLDNNSSVVARDPNDPYRWNLNISPDDLHKSCRDAQILGGISGPDMEFRSLSNASFPIYTGPPGTPAGSAFSHLNDKCDGANDEFLMNFNIPVETRRDIGLSEKRILCDLGYRVLDMENCSCTVAGNNDFTQTCTDTPITFNLCNGDTFILPYSLFLGNDTGADEIAYLVVGSADPSIDIEDLHNGTIQLVSCGTRTNSNIISLQYIPLSSTCPHEGNPVRVDIEVVPCIGCDNYLSDTPAPENDNSCNIICNSSIIAYTDEGAIVEESFIAINCAPCYEVPGWYAATITPDFWLTPNISGVSGSIGFRTSLEDFESAFTPLNMDAGRYLFSFYGAASSNVVAQPPNLINIKARLTSPEITAQFQVCNGIIESESEFNLLAGDLFTIGELNAEVLQTGQFERGAYCFELGNNNYDALWFYPATPTNNESIAFIDNVEIIPDNFTAGEDQLLTTECSIEIGHAFCMLSDVLVRYEWFEAVNNDLVPIVAYRVLNGDATPDDPDDPDNANFDFDTQTLTVAPDQTTTYVLQRSLTTPNNLPPDFELCTTEDEIVVTVESETPAFSLQSEECGLAVFSMTGIEAGDSWQIDYGDGSSGTFLSHNYGLSPATYMATLTVVNACETIDLNVEVIVAGCPELACCPSNSAMLLINTTISAAVEAGLHPGGTSLDLCIEGTLTIDEDYTFSGNLYLAPDATIIITAEATLVLDGAHLQGCEFLWNGILVQQPHINDAPSLVSHNETLIEDAKLAVNAANKVILDIRKTTFNRNFVGVYLVGVPLSGFYGNTFDCTSPLKPSISPAPYLGEYAYAGIQSRGSTMHIGVAGTTVNTFQNLRNGILNLRGDLRVENSVFYDIEKAPSEPYDFTGYGIHHQGSDFTQLDQRGLGYSTNATLTFDNCYTAVWADKGNVKARFNRMTAVHTGIHAQYCKNFSIDINHNRINCYGIGIGLLQNDPAGSITVWENHLFVNADSPNNTSGVGIFVQESGTQQSNAIVEQNPIYLYRKDRGIYLNSATGYTIRNNDLFLENTAIDGARGIVLENGKMCRVSCNNVIGNGPGEGLVSNSTSATLFSCNSVENLRSGVALNGASSATYLRSTDFVLPLTQGLLYRENIAMMPVQSHNGNLWESGSYGQAAAVHLGSGNFIYFNAQRFEIHTTSAPYYPPSILLPNSGGVPASAWFFLDPSGNPLVCNPTAECPILGFAPEEETIKDREEQLAEGDFEGEWPGGLHWAAQGQLFEKLNRAPGIMDTSTIMADFYTAKENEELGSLFALRKEIDSLLGLLPESFDTLQVYMSLTDSLLEALSFADSLAVHNPQASIPGLPQQLLARCDSLLVLSQELAGNLSVIRAALVDTLKALNESIADTAIYVSNEKIVNEIYLTTLAQDSTTLDTAQVDSLYAVAIQCPEEGGPAVYRARSLYALIALSDFDTLSCLPAAFSVQNRPREMPVSLRNKTPEFQVFPNPNHGRFTIKYQLERDGILVMTDMLGRPAFTRPMSSLVSRMNVTTSEFKPGCYYLYITSDSGEMLHVEKVIIY